MFIIILSYFYSLEDNNLLCPSNEVDLFALHYIYIPRINTHLEVFCEAYSRHRLRTEGHSTPLQLWIKGMLATRDHTAASGVYDNGNLTDVSYITKYTYNNNHKAGYCTAGFVCEVLICANYARCHRLSHFNSSVTFNSAIVLGM